MHDNHWRPDLESMFNVEAIGNCVSVVKKDFFLRQTWSHFDLLFIYNAKKKLTIFQLDV